MHYCYYFLLVGNDDVLFSLILLHQHRFSTPIARGREAGPRPPHTTALGVAAERTGAVVQLGARVACNLAIPRLVVK